MDLLKIFLLVSWCGFCCGRWQKRVINGVLLDGRPTHYKAVRYYGAITTASATPFWRSLEAFFGVYGDLWCSGELITPKIVQTACHCLAGSYTDEDGPYLPAVVKNHWEGRYTIFFGVSNRYGEDSWRTTTPVLSRKFILHEKCAAIRGALNTYDHAIIQIPYDWWKSDDTIPYAWTEFEPVPHYTIEQILQIYHYVQQKQLVCLTVGFGGTDKYDRTTKNVILHGWTVSMSKYDCYTKIGRFRFPRGNESTWVCNRHFPYHDQPAGRGDSGGPVSCDGQFYATINGHEYGILGDGTILSINNPLFYNLYINAIEYRQDLNFWIDDLVKTYRDEVYDYYKMHPTTTVKT